MSESPKERRNNSLNRIRIGRGERKPTKSLKKKEKTFKRIFEIMHQFRRENK
jgi:hypothetical protein